MAPNPQFPRTNKTIEALRRTRRLLQGEMTGDRRRAMRDLERLRFRLGKHKLQFDRRMNDLRRQLKKAKSDSSLDSLTQVGGIIGRVLAEIRELHKESKQRRLVHDMIQTASQIVQDMGSPGDISDGNLEGRERVRSRPQPRRDSSLPPNVIIRGGRYEVLAKGIRRTYDPDHPAMTGRMTPVRSSNVHSVGYDFNFENPWKSQLIIRYLQADQSRGGKGNSKRKVPGPTYAYRDVPPAMFDEILTAASKGKWVWDNIRIRGTVAGHQYRYSITRIAQGYLPRRARVINGHQKLVQRVNSVVRDGRTHMVRSPLQDKLIGKYRPGVKKPNVGNRDKAFDRRRR